MWTSSKSSALSLWCNRFLLIILILAALSAPWWLRWYTNFTNKAPELYPVLLTLIYVCSAPGVLALAAMDRLLKNIRRNQIFISQNVTLLRVLSWCCFFVSAASCVCGFWYLPILFITIAGGFGGIVLRVVKNVMAEATRIKRENELTI